MPLSINSKATERMIKYRKREEWAERGKRGRGGEKEGRRRGKGEEGGAYQIGFHLVLS